jgi:flagellar biosynthesis/type III secretory pathway protein FliH
MTLFDKPKRPAAWEPDPLLATVQSQPHFLRVNWNEKQATEFGPWRMAPLGEPLDAVEVPQDDLGIDDRLGAAADDERIDTANEQTTEIGPAAALDEDPSIQGGVLHSPDELQRIAQEAHAQGWAEGQAQAQAESAAQQATQMALVGELMNGLQALNHEPQRFFEPLKRLALHMAEQLVRGELQVSGQAVANLVKQALDTLGETREKVILHLNPMDADALSEAAPELVAQCAIESDAQLQRGSVRVSVNDTVVEDLIEHRMEALARRVLAKPEAWMKQSSLMHPVSPVTPRWAKPENKPTVSEVEDVQDLRESKPTQPEMDAAEGIDEHPLESRHDGL